MAAGMFREVIFFPSLAEKCKDRCEIKYSKIFLPKEKKLRKNEKTKRKQKLNNYIGRTCVDLLLSLW
ncbi:hypothetical protein RRG08_008191 [Elysia crispata]|uniref:Uncharacterized protein n=1 Tax=Elysia crispata TaxID=231223 RepID=A0AAE1A6S1_9GAST|nr:hypothetical protein RRG08_008191 [Elysia crispata]